MLRKGHEIRFFDNEWKQIDKDAQKFGIKRSKYIRAVLKFVRERKIFEKYASFIQDIK